MFRVSTLLAWLSRSKAPATKPSKYIFHRGYLLPARPPHPTNSFGLFFSANVDQLKNLKTAAIKWRSMSENQRKPYLDKYQSSLSTHQSLTKQYKQTYLTPLKRPASPFINFTVAMLSQIAKSGSKYSLTEVMKHLGQEWHTLPESEKRKFEAQPSPNHIAKVDALKKFKLPIYRRKQLSKYYEEVNPGKQWVGLRIEERDREWGKAKERLQKFLQRFGLDREEFKELVKKGVKGRANTDTWWSEEEESSSSSSSSEQSSSESESEKEEEKKEGKKGKNEKEEKGEKKDKKQKEENKDNKEKKQQSKESKEKTDKQSGKQSQKPSTDKKP